MQGFIIVLVILVIVIGLYLGSYVLNNRTEAPKGVEIDPGCDGCQTPSCSLQSDLNPDEECKEKIE